MTSTPSPAPRHTKSFLAERLAAAGIAVKSRYGQNFLIDLNLLDILVDGADLAERDVVLEVGTGTASLTRRMAERVGHVVSIEIDPDMHRMAGEELGDDDRVTLLLGDALKNKNTLSPLLVDRVRERLAAVPDARFKLVANLPYNVATPLISNLLDSSIVPHSMTITIQKELADRVTAAPGTKDYGSLSVWVQSQCAAQVLRTLPPEAFWPRPKVTSAFLHITLDEARRGTIADLGFWHTFARAIFAHRRKFLRGVLLAAYKDQLGKSGVDELLASLALAPSVRAEELSVETLLALCDATRARLAG